MTSHTQHAAGEPACQRKPAGEADRESSLVVRFAFRVVAAIAWWLALVVGCAAWRDPDPGIAVLGFGAAVLTFGAGVALWRGSDV